MILCIDCGLTRGKALLMDERGRCRDQASFPTPLSGSIVDTHELRLRLYGALSQMDLGDVTAVTVSGHGNGIYAIGQTDVLREGYSSMVTRSGAFVRHTFPITAQSDWPGQPLPILAWLKHTQPRVYGSIRKVLFCKDLLRWFLTDTVATELTDASAAALLNARTGTYDKALLGLYGLEDLEEKLPQLLSSGDAAGVVSCEAATRTGLPASVPVYAGLFDVNSCMLGTGVTAPGTYALIAGTWGINACVSGRPVENREITQCCRFFGGADYVCIDSAPTSCANLEWFSQKVLGNLPYDRVNRLVEQAPEDTGLLYMPYLYAPMDLPKAKGGFLGVRPEHGPGDLLRAVYEGIVFDHRCRLEKLRAAGCAADSAVLSGGGASSRLLSQMFADVCGIPVRVCEQTQAGALGGAILALYARGVYGSIGEAAEDLVRYRGTYMPDPARKAYYDSKYGDFLAERRKYQA